MKKKLNLLKNSLLILTCAFLLTGCASMDYTGSDYNEQNAGSIQTSAGFYFKTYRKHSDIENVDMTLGVTRSVIPNVYIVYINVENKNNEDYIIYQKNISYSSDTERVRLVTASEYINAFQSQETGSYAGMQALAPTISNIATIANNFQPTGQENVVYQQNTRDNLNGQLSGLTNDVASHALNNVSSVSANNKKYFYNFLEVDDSCTIMVKYKDLEYQFGIKAGNIGTEG